MFEYMQMAAPCSREDKLMLKDLTRVIPYASPNLMWSVQLWMFLGGPERVTYQRYADLVRICLGVCEEEKFQTLGDFFYYVDYEMVSPRYSLEMLNM